MRVLVLAKAPVPGRTKTRLQTRWTPEQAAGLAAAALLDTLDAVASVGVACELVLDGHPGDWVPAAFGVRKQAEGSLANRLHAALVTCDEPALLIGMDTPQLVPQDLTVALAHLRENDGCLGLAEDGGWWGLGLADPRVHAHLVLGIPTSQDDTGARQLAALSAAGLRIAALPTLRDVDRPEDADAVAELSPHTRFGRLVAELQRTAA